MSKGLLEAGMVEHCAPTLAGIKMANLFRYTFQRKQVVLEELKNINELLNARGVYVEPLLWRENSVLIYAYRPQYLQTELERIEVMELLYNYGYAESTIEECIYHLKKRLYHYECFPHEIGIFLGYPLEDVKGFIENKGKNCKSCGVWKVYCNEGEKKRTPYRDKFMAMFGIGTGGLPFIKEESVYNQFYMDLITPLEKQISVEGTMIHCFYAKKMGEMYLERYKEHFKNPTIHEFDMEHEELLVMYPKKWVDKIKEILHEKNY